MLSRKDANRLFDELNLQHWQGRLPKHQVRVVRPHREDFEPGLLGRCVHASRTIYLAGGLSTRRTRSTLLHEMCHAANLDVEPHGRPFVQRLQRLVDRGERDLQGQVDWYSGKVWGRIVDEAMPDIIAATMHVMASAPGSRAWPWSSIERLLAQTYQVRRADIRAALPQARQQWHTLRRTRDEAAILLARLAVMPRRGARPSSEAAYEDALARMGFHPVEHA
jgi:hypothetical protein